MSKKYNKKISETNVRLGLVRFAYLHIFEPRRNVDGTTGKYECVCIIPKSDTDTVTLFNEALEAAKRDGINSKWGGKIPKNLQGGLRDGDEKEDPAFADCWYFNAKSSKKPGIRVLEDGEVLELLENDDFYSGCYGAVSVNLFPYSAGGNNGVGVGLNNLIKIEDGERLSGGRTADQDFGDL